jgi:2-hydroxy-6-oxonona-2,4-dienedioate hydrolase
VINTPGNILMNAEFMRTVKEKTRAAVRDASLENVRRRLEMVMAEKNLDLVTDELVGVRTAVYREPSFDKAVENVLILQDAEVRARYTWSPEWCGKIEVPTLIIWTTDDPVSLPEHGDILREWIPGSELVYIAQAGHWPQWEQPAEFLALHRRFLADL